MNIQIRLETPADYRAVEELTREAFWAFWEPNRTICDEHLLVHWLRFTPSFVPELDFVAETDGKIVGHIIYSKSKVIDETGKEYETLTFGPLSVLTEFMDVILLIRFMRSLRIKTRLNLISDSNPKNRLSQRPSMYYWTT